jgi:hypothetical protein
VAGVSLSATSTILRASSALPAVSARSAAASRRSATRTSPGLGQGVCRIELQRAAEQVHGALARRARELTALQGGFGLLQLVRQALFVRERRRGRWLGHRQVLHGQFGGPQVASRRGRRLGGGRRLGRGRRFFRGGRAQAVGDALVCGRRAAGRGGRGFGRRPGFRLRLTGERARGLGRFGGWRGRLVGRLANYCGGRGGAVALHQVVPAGDRGRGQRQAEQREAQRAGALAARRGRLRRFHARKIRHLLLERALDVLDLVAAQRGLDEQAHARRGHRTMQEPVDHARGDLASYLGLFLGGAHHHEHQVVPGVAQPLGEAGEIALDKHAVEQRHRDAARIQVRCELGFRRDQDDIGGRIDDAAEQSDECPILRKRGDRHWRLLGVGEHGRLEFRLRQHGGGYTALVSGENAGLRQFTKICQFIGETCTKALRSNNP